MRSLDGPKEEVPGDIDRAPGPWKKSKEARDQEGLLLPHLGQTPSSPNLVPQREQIPW